MQFIKQLDFVEVEEIKMKKMDSQYDFFKSAGLWANRDFDAKEIRKRAWNREK